MDESTVAVAMTSIKEKDRRDDVTVDEEERQSKRPWSSRLQMEERGGEGRGFCLRDLVEVILT